MKRCLFPTAGQGCSKVKTLTARIVQVVSYTLAPQKSYQCGFQLAELVISIRSVCEIFLVNYVETKKLKRCKSLDYCSKLEFCINILEQAGSTFFAPATRILSTTFALRAMKNSVFKIEIQLCNIDNTLLS